MHQYFSATNFLPVNDAVSSTACVPDTGETNPENNPFIQLRPCWTGHAALRRPLPRSSPRVAGIALHRPRRAFCAAMIVEGLNWRSRRNTKSKARCALRNRKFRRVAYRHRVTHLGRPFRGDVGIVRESNAQSTQNTATRSLSVDSRFVRDWTYSAYAGRPCGYRLCASPADWSLGPVRTGNRSIKQEAT